MSNYQGGIYKITNQINNKVYIGSSKNIIERLYLHRYDLLNDKHSNPHLRNAVNYYGEENFTYETIELWMQVYKSRDREYGYNINGAYRTEPRSEETRKRISEAVKASGWKPTPEYRKKLSQAQKGRVVTAETRRKLSEAQKGKKLAPEHLENIRASAKTRKKA